MTVAPCVTAYLMPDAIASGSLCVMAASPFKGSLYSKVTRIDRIRADGAIPLLPATRLATAVPSIPQNGPPGTRPDWLKSGPLLTSPAKSDCVASTPVDSTATVTPAPLL
jgi:hypothetical protein